MKTPRILIVEDDALLRSLLTDWLKQRPEWTIAGEATNGLDGLECCRKTKPDLLIVDVSMRKLDGLSMIEQARKDQPGIKAIALTSHSDPYTIERIQRLGLQGYVSKTASLSVLETAIRKILEGGTYYDDTFLKSLTPLHDPKAFHKVLSKREIEVLQLVAEGLSDAQIGKKLEISSYTVAAHRRNIRVKLNAHNDRDMILYAHQWGLIDTRPGPDRSEPS